jgi:hypothetical protein
MTIQDKILNSIQGMDFNEMSKDALKRQERMVKMENNEVYRFAFREGFLKNSERNIDEILYKGKPFTTSQYKEYLIGYEDGFIKTLGLEGLKSFFSKINGN